MGQAPEQMLNVQASMPAAVEGAELCPSFPEAESLKSSRFHLLLQAEQTDSLVFGNGASPVKPETMLLILAPSVAREKSGQITPPGTARQRAN